MLKRLRTAHPILYCILSEVLFLGSMVLFSLLATIGLAAAAAACPGGQRPASQRSYTR